MTCMLLLLLQRVAQAGPLIEQRYHSNIATLHPPKDQYLCEDIMLTQV